MSSKFVFISNMAAPYQVKFCEALQEHIETEFWFYVRLEPDRPKWWEIPLGENCKIMKYSGNYPGIGYFSLGLYYELLKVNPSVIMLGGFMKNHILLLKLAKLLNKKVIIMSEPIRYVEKETSKSSKLRTKENSSKELKLARKLFDGADLYLGMGKTAAKQFVEEFEFPKEKVASILYPIDIEEYFNHPLRERRKEDPMRLLFANRLIDRYQPLFALKVFETLSLKYPNIELHMNSEGPLKEECLKFIKEKQLQNVHFLDEIKSWNDMNLVYKNADVIILPATYSNGNLSLFEALASGMGAVISDRVNHMEKHMIDGENCFRRELDEQQFVAAIEEYIEKPQLLMEHGKISRQLVDQLRNENLAKSYYELFRKHDLVN